MVGTISVCSHCLLGPRSLCPVRSSGRSCESAGNAPPYARRGCESSSSRFPTPCVVACRAMRRSACSPPHHTHDAMSQQLPFTHVDKGVLALLTLAEKYEAKGAKRDLARDRHDEEWRRQVIEAHTTNKRCNPLIAFGLLVNKQQRFGQEQSKAATSH